MLKFNVLEILRFWQIILDILEVFLKNVLAGIHTREADEMEDLFILLSHWSLRDGSLLNFFRLDYVIFLQLSFSKIYLHLLYLIAIDRITNELE